MGLGFRVSGFRVTILHVTPPKKKGKNGMVSCLEVRTANIESVNDAS